MLIEDEGVPAGFVAQHAPYWNDKEAIGYGLDEAFLYDLEQDDLVVLVMDLAVRLDLANLTDEEFEEDYNEQPPWSEDE